MWGPSLALLSRGLRVDARLLRTHLFRALFVVIIFFSMAIAHLTSIMVGAPGLHFFESITWLNFVFITLAGLSYFATAITEEKDESMLGLLRMAGIGPLSLMLGKSTTRLATSLLILSVQFPFTFLAVTLGGVTLGQVIAVYLALVAYMIFLANLGLFCSVYARGSARAAALMTMVVGLFLGVVPLLHNVVNDLTNSGKLSLDDKRIAAVVNVVEWLWDASIINRLNLILETGFDQSPFSGQVVSNLVAAVALFVISWVSFDRLTDERSTEMKWRDYLGPASSRTGRRKPIRVWNNPFFWKDFYFAAGGRRALLVKCILFTAGAGVYLAVLLSSGKFGDLESEEFSDGIRLMAIGISAVELSIYAANLFREEVRSKTLSTLMLLPISTSRIVISKLLCMIPALIPALFFFLVGCAFANKGFVATLVETLKAPQTWLVLAGFVMFLHLTAYFSLLVRWGALPLAIFSMYFTHACLVFPMVAMFALIGRFSGNSYVYVVPYVIVSVTVCAILEVLVAKRLEEIATH